MAKFNADKELMTVENIHWDEETDVVILGCGGADAVAAIAASDAGAKVIVVEKGESGGNTRLATMAFLCPTNNSAAREHIKALSFGEESTIGFLRRTFGGLGTLWLLGTVTSGEFIDFQKSLVRSFIPFQISQLHSNPIE